MAANKAPEFSVTSLYGAGAESVTNGMMVVVQSFNAPWQDRTADTGPGKLGLERPDLVREGAAKRRVTPDRRAPRAPRTGYRDQRTKDKVALEEHWHCRRNGV